MATIVTILTLLLFLFFAFASVMKLIAHPHMREEFASFVYPYWLARFSALLEVIGCTGIVIGIWRPGFTALGCLLLSTVLLGATYTNFISCISSSW